MAAKFRPSDVSRDEVQVVLRASTSTSPDCSAVKRSFAVSGTNLTLVGSLKIAAASALQKSTSSPAQRPCESGSPNPASVPFDPQLSTPLCLIVLRVWADAADAASPKTAANATRTTRLFMTQISQNAGSGVWCLRAHDQAFRHRDDGRPRAVARDPGRAGVLRRGDERLSRPQRRAQSEGQR